MGVEDLYKGKTGKEWNGAAASKSLTSSAKSPQGVILSGEFIRLVTS
jgi:hypothetical protein